MRKAVFLLLFLCAASFASNDEALKRIWSGVEQTPVIRAGFEQTKRMPSLKRPLMLSGRLVFSRQYGVLWRIEKPYSITYILGENKVVEIGSDEVRRERGQSDVPGLAQIGRIFRAMLSADMNVLQEYFEVNTVGNAERWEVALTPRQAQLAQFLSGMRLSGGRFVENLVIDETNGDSSTIRFTGTQGDNAPNEEELKLFSAESPEKP